MQLFKKIMAGALSLAVICGAMFAFVGCNEVKGKTYEYSGLTFTIITEFENDEKIGTEEAVIKATRTLTAREFYILKEVEGATLENLATTTTEATDKEILEWCENFVNEMGGQAKDGLTKAKATTFNFKSNKVEMIEEEEPNIYTGDKSREVVTGKYTIEDGLIEVVIDGTMDMYPAGYAEYDIDYYHVAGENVEKQIKLLTKAEQYTKEGLLSFSIVFGEVK